LGPSRDSDYCPNWFGSYGKDNQPSLLDRLDALAPDEASVLSALLRKQAASIGRAASHELRAQRTAASLSDAATLLERLPSVKRYESVQYAKAGLDPELREAFANLNRARWAFENDLTKCAFIRVTGLAWDTHVDNSKQVSLNSDISDLLSRFLSDLSSTRQPRGPLDEQTLVVVGSELGRNPRMNRQKGKDHFPEIPLLFFGAGINTNGGRGATFGQTGREMESLPISTKDGKPSGGHDLIELDDVGATLLRIAGVEPTVYGYDGRSLEFLREV
jgi:hypothetical protein